MTRTAPPCGRHCHAESRHRGHISLVRGYRILLGGRADMGAPCAWQARLADLHRMNALTWRLLTAELRGMRGCRNPADVFAPCA